MEYKDFIKDGNKVIHVPYLQDENLYCYDAEIVTIGKYRPYFTDGTPDPTPDEYCEWCYVEIEGETSWGECQIRLDSLLPIVEEEMEILYDGRKSRQIGRSEDGEWIVLESGEVVDCEYCEIVRHISNLDFEQLKELRGEFPLGSLYICDYYNSFGIDAHELCDYADGFGSSIDWDENLDTPENFAEYCLDACA